MVYAIILLMIGVVWGFSAMLANAQTVVPTFTVQAVTRNNSVTISGVNFPPNQTFTVRMGPYGGYGVGGAVSTTAVNTGNGSFTTSIAIPAAVQNFSRIAMRLDNGSIYYSYNWFWNNTTNPAAPALDQRETAPKLPAANTRTVNPTIGIEQIEGETVSFQTYDFPANHTFNVFMGSRGSGGYSDYIGTFNSGDGSNQVVMVNIPPRIAHYGYIWLRLDSGVYSPYVGFDNPADISLQPRQGDTSGTPPQRAVNAPVWHGTPTITMCAVVAGNNVTFVSNNLTTNLDYTVRMNAFGTLGHNGYVVGTVSPGNNPSVRATFNIPGQLAGHQRIALRLDAAGGYNAYNWFWNNTATVC